MLTKSKYVKLLAMPDLYPITNNANQTVKNPLDPKTEPTGPASTVYDEKDKEYLNFLQIRLQNAKKQKDQTWPELNNKTPYQYYEDNEKIANTHHLDQKKNDDDVVISAGTIEQKLDALLSNINNLNLSLEVMSFDRSNKRVVELGEALQDIIHDTEIREPNSDSAGDEEKKMARQRELLKQGTVYVQEEWLRKFEIKKALRQKYNGEFKNFAGYDEKLELVFEGPSRTMLYGPNVFLGDMTQFYMELQPYVFVMFHQDYNVAKSKFGKFENWKYVVPGAISSATPDTARTIFDNKWRLTELKKEQVEIIMYQDQTRDEFQILINGVCMLPIGFPLSAVSPGGKYNIAKQIYRVINDKFALGGSFVSSGSIKEISALIDEMLKLFVLKTRKSFTPAYVNTSGRVIDRKVLSPGRISMGIDPGALQPIASNETQGVTAGELGVLKELQGLVTKSTVSDQFTGQQGGAGTTATEVIELQRQARLTLGLTIAVCALLEKKLGYLRLWNILENWFEPVDTRVEQINEARKMVNVYRSVNSNVNISGEGVGERQIIVQDQLPSPTQIRTDELNTEKLTGAPIRKIYISPSGLKTAKLTWYLVVTPKEKESSAFFKLMFREQLNDMLTLMQLGSMPNTEGLEEQFAENWGKSRAKLFQLNKGGAMQMGPDMGGVSAAIGASQAQNSSVRGRSNPAGIPALPGGLGMAS